MKYSLQNKRGYYHAVVSFKDENGKYRQKSISTKIPVQKGNKRRAQKAADELVTQWTMQQEQKEAEKLDLSLTRAIELFNEAKRSQVQFSTHAGYVKLGNELAKFFGADRLAQVNRKKIDQFLCSIREKGSGENTVRHYCVYLNSMLHFVESVGYALAEPGLQIKPPAVPRFTGASYYTADEVKRLLAAADESGIRIPIYIAVYLGLRRSEICGLYWDMIDLKSRTIRICRKAVQYWDADGKQITELSDKMKTVYSDRTLPIPDALYNVLNEETEKSGPLCKREDGSQMQPQYLSSAFFGLLKKTGLRKIRFHELRHTCASLLLSAGAGMKEVQVILGHGSYSTTADIYSHIDLSGKSRAIAGLSHILEHEN